MLSMEFKLTTEFIELDNLLKVLGLVAHGAEAKEIIRAGSVRVNTEVETRVRRKLRAGDCVEFNGKRIAILA